MPTAPLPPLARTPDACYAIRTRKGVLGITYRVSFIRKGRTRAQLFRAHDYNSASAALQAARAWRDYMLQLEAMTGGPRRRLTREYPHWQMQTSQGLRPLRLRWDSPTWVCVVTNKELPNFITISLRQD
jgi:hypothetical protein